MDVLLSGTWTQATEGQGIAFATGYTAAITARQTFTATSNGQASFTLSASAAAIISLAVNGLTQNTADVSLSGATTVVLAGGLAATILSGDTVMVSYERA